MVYKSDKTYTNSAIKGTLSNCMNFDEIFMHYQKCKLIG